MAHCLSQICMQALDLQLQEGQEATGPEDTARAARKVWELREQMTQQAAHHRRVCSTAREICPCHPSCSVQ